MSNIESEELSVTIKVLRVNSKRMTLSVFKQLPHRDIMGEDLGIRGVIWGKVNYHFPKQPPYETNIIWQSGSELYCSSISRLLMSAEHAKKHYEENGYETVEFQRSVPNSGLRKAIKTESELLKLEELFHKYREVYKTLVTSEQLYIAT